MTTCDAEGAKAVEVCKNSSTEAFPLRQTIEHAFKRKQRQSFEKFTLPSTRNKQDCIRRLRTRRNDRLTNYTCSRPGNARSDQIMQSDKLRRQLHRHQSAERQFTHFPNDQLYYKARVRIHRNDDMHTDLPHAVLGFELSTSPSNL